MLRFSLLMSFLIILAIGIGCAALVNPTDVWRQVIVTGITALLIMAALVAIARGFAAPFARGFATTGWLYVLLVFSPFFALQQHLCTERILRPLYKLIHSSDASWVASPPHLPGYMYCPQMPLPRVNATPVASPVPTLGPSHAYNFTAIGRSLWTIILASIGGLFTTWLGRRRVDPPTHLKCSGSS